LASDKREGETGQNERDGTSKMICYDTFYGIFHYSVSFKALICCIPFVVRQIAFESFFDKQ